MSGLSPTRYLFYSTLTGLMWATLVSTAGYWVGRLLNLQAKAFEDNFLFIVLSFALFGLIVGYIIRTLALRRMKAE
jgi:membrane protein DedA with SNARE-associated domain